MPRFRAAGMRRSARSAHPSLRGRKWSGLTPELRRSRPWSVAGWPGRASRAMGSASWSQPSARGWRSGRTSRSSTCWVGFGWAFFQLFAMRLGTFGNGRLPRELTLTVRGVRADTELRVLEGRAPVPNLTRRCRPRSTERGRMDQLRLLHERRQHKRASQLATAVQPDVATLLC